MPDPTPPTVVALLASIEDLTPTGVRRVTGAALDLVRSWTTEDRFADARLAVVTIGATGDDPDPVFAAVWGLVRSAQTEHPGRFVLLDLDTHTQDLAGLLGAALATGESQVAVRGGDLLVPRLARSGAPSVTLPAGEPHWRLDAGESGTLDDLRPVPTTPSALRPGEVRVTVRATGVNFRDTMIALGVYPDEAILGSEIAGVVGEVGPEVTGLAVGDRVTGLVAGGFGTDVVADAHTLVEIPPGWTFAEAAAVPIAFCTAYYALVDLAGLTEGESVLVHAAAGGVGGAAVQIAHYLGAEVYATASPAKWPSVDVTADHLSSSRTTDFEGEFHALTHGRGVDIVLNSLAGEFVDASLRLLPFGGRFVEMGKTDPRDPDEVATHHRGVRYRAFDLAEAGPE
ncbi:MAG: zinc-binding dehydrogenase, partial [Actinomycetota bacterium]|nr:zinc-binding dehydrogenase [Actinomycetota bacterium]